MEIVNIPQGSPEWHAHRAQHWNASDAPAMMGCSPYKTRTQLMHELHTGICPDVDAQKQRIFDEGHRFEALARPMAEAIVGEELYPVVGTRGRLSASFDGLTIDESVAFEHKTLNEKLKSAMVDCCVGADLPIEYQVQMQHQLMVSGARRVLFMASIWDEDDRLIEERHCWYDSDPRLAIEIAAGWDQFAQDLAIYTPAPVVVAPIAKTVACLPVVFDMRVEGKLIACNLAQYKPAAMAYIEAINTELESDQSFADAEADAKFCRESADKLKLAIEQAMGQMGDINNAINTVRDIAAAFDAKGLKLEKLVKARKDEMRAQIVMQASIKLNQHIAALHQRISMDRVIAVSADFAGAVKGKRSLASIHDAVDTELARAKIAASELADQMEANIKSLKGEAHDWGFLFPDLATVAGKPTEDFVNLLTARIGAHKQAEAARNAREAEAKAAAVVQQAATQAPMAQVLTGAVVGGTGIDPEQTHDTGERIKLGDINARISPISINADGLNQLGFAHVATDKSAKLYRECDLPKIFDALVAHIIGARAKHQL